MRANPIISLEGIHGVGKSTLGQLLIDRTKALGIDLSISTDQTATETGRLVRQLNLHMVNKLDPLTELFLVAAARREAFIETIRPELDRGGAVLTERFIHAFFAFGRVRGTHEGLLRTVAYSVTDGHTPDFVILLDCPAEVALARVPPEERHRVEREPLDFHRALRDAYLSLARQEQNRFVILDATLPPEELANRALAILLPRLQVLPRH